MIQKDTLNESGKYNTRMPLWFRIIFLFMLAWGLFFGYGVYTGNSSNESKLASMPQAVRELFLDIPTWAMFAAGIGVITSLIGVILILLGRKIGAYILLIPPIMFILRDGWFLIDGRVFDLISKASLIISSLGVFISIIQSILAFYGLKKNWLE